MKHDFNAWYATLTALQFTICMVLFVYMKIQSNRQARPIKVVRLYLGLQWLAWFALNLCFVEILNFEKHCLENVESIARFIALIAFYYSLDSKAEYIRAGFIALPLLLLSLWIIQWNTHNLNFILRLANGIAGITLGSIFFRRLLKELPVENLGRYPLFWFNTAFIIRSGGIVWMAALVTFSSPMKSIDNALLNEFFSVLGVVESLLLLLGIANLEGKEISKEANV
jgi:heme/copper-type cytochrome/quinol oxidase subunit 4